jgi:hypothetical protein
MGKSSTPAMVQARMSVMRSWLGAEFLFTPPGEVACEAAPGSASFQIDAAAATPLSNLRRLIR